MHPIPDHVAALLTETGHWEAPADSPHRSLTPAEVSDAVRMAETTAFAENDPSACDCATRTEGRCGYHQDPRANAPWEAHHPVVRAVWEQRGIRPTLGASQ